MDPHVIYADNLSPDFNLYGENPDVVHLLGGRSPQINSSVCYTHHTNRTNMAKAILFFWIGQYDSTRLLTKL